MNELSDTKVKCSLHSTFLELANRPCLTIPTSSPLLKMITDDIFNLSLSRNREMLKPMIPFYRLNARKERNTYYQLNIIIENCTTKIASPWMIQKYTFAKVEREHGTRTYKNRQQDIFKSTFSIRIYYLSNILFMNLQRKIGIADTSHTINSSISDRVFASPPSSFQFDRSVFRNECRDERNFRGEASTRVRPVFAP